LDASHNSFSLTLFTLLGSENYDMPKQQPHDQTGQQYDMAGQKVVHITDERILLLNN